MTSPHSVVMASVRFVRAASAMNSTEKGRTSESECGRVCSMIQAMSFDHHEATHALEALHTIRDDVWTDDQRTRIAKTLQTSLTNLANIADMTRNHSKEQECIKVYNYFPPKLWALCKSDETIKNKFRHVAHFLVDVMRLRNPNAQTKRFVSYRLSSQHQNRP